ncbi:MAG: response regulator [candidate division FCPU426 bacterium]|jgi:DNA-binding NtrC family response regulator
MPTQGLGKTNGSKPEGSGPKKGPAFTTLVVDGKQSLDLELGEFLKREEHRILRADSAEKAIVQTRQFQPDLILLDSEIGGVSGLALLGGLLLEQYSAAVIMVSSHPSVAEAVEAVKRGAVDYLAVPLDLTRLKLSIDAQKDFINM